jgi:heterodisulfide reductase subunit B
MCHLNLEVRCNLKDPIPTMHFSELLSLALGVRKHEGWFSRHLVDPRPMLKEKALIR